MDNEKLLEKWLNNDLTSAELKKFEQLDDFNLNNEIIEGAKSFKASHFSSHASFSEFKTKLKNEEKPVIQLSAIKMLTRIAAIFVIGIGVYFAFFNNNLTTVQTLASQNETFELPDASTVTLNATSTIKFDEDKWSDKRELSLKGEAYFKVAKGSKFDVKTSNGIVSVLGTQFTVKQRDNFFEVKCFEGVVSVSRKGELHRLTKGKTYRSLNGKISLNTTDKENPDWLHNITSFESVPIIEVLKELERQYNVSIKTENIDTKRIFTGGFVNNNLEQALQSISVPLNLSYKNNGENKITFFKKSMP